MGWFDEQIRKRLSTDQENFAEAFADMSSVVMGKKAIAQLLNDDKKKTRDAIDEILKFYRVKSGEVPESMTDINDQLDFLLRPAGIMRRTVKLEPGWYKDAAGPMLASTREGDTISLIPRGVSGYTFLDYKTGEIVRVNKKNADSIGGEAICFYKPLPQREMSVRDLFVYMLSTFSISDLFLIALATIAATLVGMVAPYANNLLFNKIIPYGESGILAPVLCLMLGAAIATTLMTITKTLVLGRVKTKMSLAVQSAAMMRVLSLPADFFKKYSSGELSSRTQYISGLCNMLLDAILSTALTSVFSLAYIGQMATYAPALVAPAMAVIAFIVLISALSVVMQIKVTRKKMECAAKTSGLVFSLFSGVQKIKLAGAEKRAFSKWAGEYKREAELQYNPPLFLKLNSILSTAITLLGTVAIYYIAAAGDVGVANYMAFNVAYGMVSTAFTALSGVALTFANVKPIIGMIAPILETRPEVSSDKQIVTRLSGNIEINNLSFRYTPDMPLVLDDLSVKIRAGQYIAIVGSTGCGKSTLMRLLLGFEKPNKGAVYYDGKDVSSLDIRTFRQVIGVVLQNGKLFSGDIYSNIVISAPWLNMEAAWEAAELAGIADDIRHMPMGMHTIISEGGGGISGGQRQRLLIARAIAPKPKILMFDEATSALDNITQKRVSEALGALKCTRIVIAHRLSTIKQCDRIIVLDKGRIIEDGNYTSLIARDGFFAELVKRQQLDPVETA